MFNKIIFILVLMVSIVSANAFAATEEGDNGSSAGSRSVSFSGSSGAENEEAIDVERIQEDLREAVNDTAIKEIADTLDYGTLMELSLYDEVLHPSIAKALQYGMDRLGHMEKLELIESSMQVVYNAPLSFLTFVLPLIIEDDPTSAALEEGYSLDKSEQFKVAILYHFTKSKWDDAETASLNANLLKPIVSFLIKQLKRIEEPEENLQGIIKYWNEKLEQAEPVGSHPRTVEFFYDIFPDGEGMESDDIEVYFSRICDFLKSDEIKARIAPAEGATVASGAASGSASAVAS